MIPQQVIDFCDENGYTEPQWVDRKWWAFPPHGVMPVELPIASQSVREINRNTIYLDVEAESFGEALQKIEWIPGDIVCLALTAQAYLVIEDRSTGQGGCVKGILLNIGSPLSNAVAL